MIEWIEWIEWFEWLALAADDSARGAAHRGMALLAGLTLVLAGLIIALAIFARLRLLRRRAEMSAAARGPTQLTDAWAEAGRRAEAFDAEPEDSAESEEP